MLTWLKEILGEGYSEETERKIAAEIGRAFVARADFNAVNQAKKKLEEEKKEWEQRFSAEEQADRSALLAEIDRLREEIGAAEEAHAAELTRIRKTAALELVLAGKVHDPTDILDQFDLDELALDDKGRLCSDIEPLLIPLRERKPYLFFEGDEPPAPTIAGAIPAVTADGENAASAEMQEWRRGAGLSL